MVQESLRAHDRQASNPLSVISTIIVILASSSSAVHQAYLIKLGLVILEGFLKEA